MASAAAAALNTTCYICLPPDDLSPSELDLSHCGDFVHLSSPPVKLSEVKLLSVY